MRPRVIVVVKRTAYRLYIEEEHDRRIVGLLKKNDPVVRRMRISHREHEGTIEEVGRALEKLGVAATWVRRAHAKFQVGKADMVITVGGDGTLLAASHRVGDAPILAVNSAPSHSVGFFCGAQKGRVMEALDKALARDLAAVKLARMEVLINDTPISTRVLNDALFCHRSPAATSRYIVCLGARVEEQKSSGFWVGPAAGSTAAQRSAGGRTLPLASRQLQLVVREPYTPAGEHLRLTRVLVSEKHELRVQSKMRDGMLFLDGPYEATAVKMGDRLVFRRSRESLTVLGITQQRGWATNGVRGG
jgi:NAD+ kinase